MGNCGIYAILNMQSCKTYIGSSVNLKNRLYNHKYELHRNNHPNKHLQASWNQYGEEAFRFIIVEEVEDRENLLIREQYYIDNCLSYVPVYGFNIARLAAAPLLGQQLEKHSIESILKMICVRRKQGRNMERCFKVILPDGERLYLPRKYNLDTKKQIIDYLLAKYDWYFSEYWEHEKTKVCLDIFAQYLIDENKTRGDGKILSRHKMDEMINGGDNYINFSDLSKADRIAIRELDSDEDERE